MNKNHQTFAKPGCMESLARWNGLAPLRLDPSLSATASHLDMHHETVYKGHQKNVLFGGIYCFVCVVFSFCFLFGDLLGCFVCVLLCLKGLEILCNFLDSPGFTKNNTENGRPVETEGFSSKWLSSYAAKVLSSKLFRISCSSKSFFHDSWIYWTPWKNRTTNNDKLKTVKNHITFTANTNNKHFLHPSSIMYPVHTAILSWTPQYFCKVLFATQICSRLVALLSLWPALVFMKTPLPPMSRSWWSFGSSLSSSGATPPSSASSALGNT